MYYSSSSPPPLLSPSSSSSPSPPPPPPHRLVVGWNAIMTFWCCIQVYLLHPCYPPACSCVCWGHQQTVW
jgi:hypothetical protein